MATIESRSRKGREAVGRLRTLLRRARSTEDAYLTVAVVGRGGSGRSERALGRLDLTAGSQPGPWLRDVLAEHRPAGGDRGYRIRLWRRGGSPLGGVMVALASGTPGAAESAGSSPASGDGVERGERAASLAAELQAERARRRLLSEQLATERQRREAAEAELSAARAQADQLHAELAELEALATYANSMLDRLAG